MASNGLKEIGLIGGMINAYFYDARAPPSTFSKIQEK